MEVGNVTNSPDVTPTKTDIQQCKCTMSPLINKQKVSQDSGRPTRRDSRAALPT